MLPSAMPRKLRSDRHCSAALGSRQSLQSRTIQVWRHFIQGVMRTYSALLRYGHDRVLQMCTPPSQQLYQHFVHGCSLQSRACAQAPGAPVAELENEHAHAFMVLSGCRSLLDRSRLLSYWHCSLYEAAPRAQLRAHSLNGRALQAPRQIPRLMGCLRQQTRPPYSTSL